MLLKNHLLPVSIIVAALILANAFIQPPIEITPDVLAAEVLPTEGVILPVVWGNLGAKLVEAGVIDEEKFKSLHSETSFLEEGNDKLEINPENARMILNLLWALGLGNKNEILETGPTSDPRYGGADRFASTGGWTLARGGAMEHYSRHDFVGLTPEQQELVERVSKNIYRPCCGNSTYFPDCNHGMAMLGLLELMAARGVSEEEMYKVALIVNSYWFPDTYLTIATFLENQGVKWADADPQEILGANYSSATGFSKIASQVTLPGQRQGGGCSV